LFFLLVKGEWWLNVVVHFDVKSLAQNTEVTGMVVVNIDQLRIVHKQNVTLSNNSTSVAINIKIDTVSEEIIFNMFNKQKM